MGTLQHGYPQKPAARCSDRRSVPGFRSVSSASGNVGAPTGLLSRNPLALAEQTPAFLQVVLLHAQPLTMDHGELARAPRLRRGAQREGPRLEPGSF